MLKFLLSLLAPNQAQFQSYVAHALTAGGAAVAVSHPWASAWFSPEIVGSLAAFLGLLYNHALHGDKSGGSATPTLPGLAMLAVFAAALLGAGCAGTQVTTHESGYGAKGHITVPVPGTQTSLIDGSLIIGWFKSTQSVQPTSTNHLYTPSVAIADVSHGAETVSGGVGTNTAATIGAGTGDKYLFISGDTVAEDGTNRTKLDGWNYTGTNK